MVGAAYYYIYFNPLYQANQQLEAKIKDKKAENDPLKLFEPKLTEVNRQHGQPAAAAGNPEEDRSGRQGRRPVHQAAA